MFLSYRIRHELWRRVFKTQNQLYFFKPSFADNISRCLGVRLFLKDSSHPSTSSSITELPSITPCLRLTGLEFAAVWIFLHIYALTFKSNNTEIALFCLYLYNNHTHLQLISLYLHFAQRSCWCPIPGSVKGQVEWGCEHSNLVEGVPNHGRGVETGWFVKSLPIPPILCFYEFEQSWEQANPWNFHTTPDIYSI